MSWMDSWSRPTKNTATPPPLYLTDSANVKYCAYCGRHIGARRSHAKNKIVKYCSDRCRKHRMGPLDRKIDSTILSLLLGEEGSGVERTGAAGKFRKGDRRVVVTCDEIERIVFGRDVVEGEGNGEGEDRDGEDGEGEGDGDDGSLTHGSDAEEALAEGGVSTGIVTVEAKTAEEVVVDTRRQEGQRRAEERERVRRGARRAVVFGFDVDAPEPSPVKSKGKSSGKEQPSEDAPKRMCEAVSNGQVVEPSFAKGNWSIRWRE